VRPSDYLGRTDRRQGSCSLQGCHRRYARTDVGRKNSIREDFRSDSLMPDAEREFPERNSEFGIPCSVENLQEFQNSLFGRINSLLVRKFSLFDRVGNSIEKPVCYRCLAGRISAKGCAKLRKFPVFPLGIRESAWGEWFAGACALPQLVPYLCRESPLP